MTLTAPIFDQQHADARVDGLATYLQMLGRVVSPSGSWSSGTSEASATFLDVLRVTCAALPGADAVTVTKINSGRARTVASTDASGMSADAVQFASRQGPCLTAVIEDRPTVAGDIRSDERWQALAQIADRVTARSVFSVPLAEVGMPHAAMNVYSGRDEAWADRTAGGVVSDAVLAGALMALTAISYRGRVSNLEKALESNRTIGAAIGVVMTQHHCSQERAFALITQCSQNGNIKLRTVAEGILDTGVLPTSSVPAAQSL